MKCKKCGYESPIHTPATGQGIATSTSGEKGGFKLVRGTSVCARSAVSRTRNSRTRLGLPRHSFSLPSLRKRALYLDEQVTALVLS
jgi:hypothetical protein